MDPESRKRLRDDESSGQDCHTKRMRNELNKITADLIHRERELGDIKQRQLLQTKQSKRKNKIQEKVAHANRNLENLRNEVFRGYDKDLATIWLHILNASIDVATLYLHNSSWLWPQRKLLEVLGACIDQGLVAIASQSTKFHKFDDAQIKHLVSIDGNGNLELDKLFFNNEIPLSNEQRAYFISCISQWLGDNGYVVNKEDGGPDFVTKGDTPQPLDANTFLKLRDDKKNGFDAFLRKAKISSQQLTPESKFPIVPPKM